MTCQGVSRSLPPPRPRGRRRGVSSRLGRRRDRYITREHVCQRYVLAGYVTCSRTAVFDPGRAGGVAMAVASGMRAAGRSRVCWRRLAAGTSGTAPARAPPGASRSWKRWLARIFRVRGGSCAHGELRHCATSGREGCGAEGERYAPATFLSRRTVRHRPARGPRRGERPPTPRGGAGPARGPPRRSPAGSAAARREAAAKGPSPVGGPATRSPADGWGSATAPDRRTRVRYALFPLLRLFTLHCTRKGSVAKGGGAQ